MINISFNILLTVTVEHSYFKNLIDAGLTIEPAPDTEIELRGLGLLFKPIKGGFVILYEKKSANNPAPKIPLTEDFKLSFIIKSSNPFFFNYSQLPLNHKLPHVFYLSNRLNNVSNSNLLLTKEQNLGKEEQIKLHKKQFRFSGTSANSMAKVEIKLPDGTEKFTENVAVDTDSGTFEKLFTLSHFPTGRYDLFVDGTLAEKLYLADSGNMQPLALLEIFNTDLAAPYRFLDGSGNPAPKYYKINIARRETFWKYYVVIKNYEEDPGLQLNYSEAEEDEAAYPDSVVFNPASLEPQIEAAYGPGKILLFTSADKIPLYELPKKNINLQVTKQNGNGNGNGNQTEIILKNLPNAGINKIVPDPDNENARSEIFIYL